MRTSYDALGRVIARVDQLGGRSVSLYSIDGLNATRIHPNGSTIKIVKNANDVRSSVSGSAVTPEFRTISISPNGIMTLRVVRGSTPNSPRFSIQYKNMLGRTIREECSGYQGETLATTHNYDSLGRLVSTAADYESAVDYTYDMLGNRVATTRSVFVGTMSVQLVEWRRTETTSCFALLDNAVWLTQTNIVSCSDAAIAPLVSSSARQLTGLTPAFPFCSRSVDIRGNITETKLHVAVPVVTSSKIVPYATNRPLTISRYGVELQTVSVSAVTNTVAYDSLGRQIANTDGRGNTSRIEYNALGQRSASIDALGNRTAYAYDPFGNLASVTDPLGNAIVYEYDLRGLKTYEGGATYPVRYTYDVFGNKTTMMTYRNESLGADSGDVTTWLYDEASGSMTNKVYADGKGPTYSYTPDGKLAQRIWARGIVTDYTYDVWGNLTNTVYSDDTPTVTLAYDALGRQTEAHDAAGVTTFLYDEFGSVTNETVVGVAGTNTIERYWDEYGRTAGYALNGTRQTTLAYCPATGRIKSMFAAGSTNAFHWSYAPGSDLKAQLLYPNGLTASWQYDAVGQLLQVCNATPTNIISQYDYTYDQAGRRIECHHSGAAFDTPDQIYYGYNARSELTNAVAVVDSDYRYAYDFDDIGNRKSAFERVVNIVYTANCLNQYTAVDSFAPQFDDDGNQTLVKTSTGVWYVSYNGENRPVLWENVSTNLPTSNASTTSLISMSYDCMGRRVEKNDDRFIYDGYLLIADNIGNIYIWSPAYPVATRLLLQHQGANIAYHKYDGNKNLSEEIWSDNKCSHFNYAPFGSQLASNGHFPKYGFSSEYKDVELDLIYYNFRHLQLSSGRWVSRDPFYELYPLVDAGFIGDYLFASNNPIGAFDMRGLDEPGCDIVGAIPGWESDCRLRCCAKHDECYDKNKCSAWSWFNLLNPFTCPTRCDDCNIEVVFCTEQCFSGHDNPPRPWDRPKPNGGKYYCATLHKYIADPNDCPKKSN